MSRKILPKRTPLPKMAAPSSSPEPSAPPLEDFCLPLLRQKSLNRYSPYYDHDEQRARMSIDNEGSWVHITKVRELEAAIREEVTLLRTELRKQVFCSKVVFDRDVYERAKAEDPDLRNNP